MGGGAGRTCCWDAPPLWFSSGEINRSPNWRIATCCCASFAAQLILKAVVRAFESERGKPPATQTELVQLGYLPRLPEDPYADGKPFGYRVSPGETLRIPTHTMPQTRLATKTPDPYELAVRPGRVIIWSLGVDRLDQGGRVPPGDPRAQDIVFLVPLPRR